MDKSQVRKILGGAAAILALAFGAIATKNIDVVAEDRGWDQFLKNYGPGMISYIGEHWAWLLTAFFAGAAVALLVSEMVLAKKGAVVGQVSVAGAKLRLLFRDGHDAPERISHENIWYWYDLKNIFVGENKETGERSESPLHNLFLVFDAPVTGGSVRVTSPDCVLPRYEVKELRQRFLIVVFGGHIPSGTLEIEVY